jgi:hypothetical protein
MWDQAIQNRDSSEWKFAPAASAFAKLRQLGEALVTLALIVIFLAVSTFFMFAVMVVDLKSKVMGFKPKGPGIKAPVYHVNMSEGPSGKSQNHTFGS